MTVDLPQRRMRALRACTLKRECEIACAARVMAQQSVSGHEGDPTRCAALRSCCFHATLRSVVEAFAFGACLLRSPERRPLEQACRSSRAPPQPHSSCTCRSAQAARTARASTSSLLESSTRLQAVRLAPRSKGCSCQVPAGKGRRGELLHARRGGRRVVAARYLRGNQWQSVAIRGLQRSSEVAARFVCMVPGQRRARHRRHTAAGVTLGWNARDLLPNSDALCLIWIPPWASANRRHARPRFACAARGRLAL